MKKKLWIILLAALMTTSFMGGCGKKDDAAEMTAIQESEPVPEDNTQEDDSHSKNNRILWTLANSDCDTYGFCDERAWVMNESGYYLVNTKGKVVFAVDNGANASINMDMYGMHPFQDGVSYIEGTVGEHSVTVLLDTDGNEISRLVSGPEEVFRILGYADGIFVVLNIHMDMDSYESYIYTIGKDGKVINAPRRIGDPDTKLAPDEYSFDYLGEGIFWLGNYFYNANNGSIQTMATETYTPLGKLHEGKTLVRAEGSYKIYVADTKDFEKDRSNLVFGNEYPAGDQCGSDCTVTMGHVINTDSYNCAVYDMNGNPLGWFDPLKKHEILNITPYEDGYTAVGFIGADDCSYITLFDPDGKMMYTPVKAGDVEYEQQGYLQITSEEGLKFLYPDGSLHSWNDNLKAMKKLNFGAVGDGFVLLADTDANDDNWDFTEEGAYKFISLNQKKSFTFQMTKKTKTLDMSHLETTKAPEAAEDTVTKEAETAGNEDAADIMDNTLNNIVLFEQDGVKLVIQDEMTIELINENPENKIAGVEFYGVFYNGISTRTDGTYYLSASAQSGSAESIGVGIDFNDYQSLVSSISSELADIPVEMITYHFGIKIGTASETQTFIKTLLLPGYNEKDMQMLYGNKIGDFTAGNVTLTAYRLETNTGIGVILQNNMDNDITIPGQPRWGINGTILSEKLRLHYDYIPQGSAVIYTFDESADSIRKKMEIPNDIPVKAHLDMYVDTTSLIDGEELHIDVGELK